MPYRREAEHEAEHADEKARARVRRHVDVAILRRLADAESALLAVCELVERVHGRDRREVVRGRRRSRRPFERASAPRIARRIAVLGQPPIAQADGELQQLACDADRDQRRAARGDDEPRMPGGVVVVIQAARHAHEAEHIQRHERDIEADLPEPERGLAERLVQLEAEHLRKPVIEAREIAKQHAADDHVVKVRDQEQAVVQHEVRAGNRHHHARHPAERERHHEADRPEDRRREFEPAAIDREQPVEHFHAGRDRDHHRHHPEERVHVRARTHREEVVQPHEERQHHDRARRVHHRLVAEQRLLRVGGDHFREDPERGQDQDVDFRMTPRPDQVQIQHRVAAGVVREEVHAEVAVEAEQRERDRQDRERRHDQHVRAERRPREHRHLHQCHAGRAHAQDRHEEVHAREQRADAGYLQRPQVIVDADARTELQLRERRIREPARLRELADDERDVDQDRRDRRHPEAQRIDERKRDVARADLQRHDDVHQADHERHRHEEDHDDAVRGEDLVIVVRRQIAGPVVRERELQAHHHRVGEAAQQHDERDDDVHHAELLVVDGREPLAPQPFPALRIGERAQNPEHDERHERARAHDDRLIERDRRKRQFTEHAYLFVRQAASVRSRTRPSLYFAMMLLKSRGSTVE
ncbi:hypothetical protein DM46_2854 [Burkholderia mallei]|nr:hypothetical protein DM46_2854 [Burkholderia mallei]